jgi:hypothetical protein
MGTGAGYRYGVRDETFKVCHDAMRWASWCDDILKHGTEIRL